MPTTITTEAARVALAHREYREAAADIARKLEARVEALKRDPRATDKAAFQKLCAEDPEFLSLVLDEAASKVWHDGVIADGAVATIEDDGSVRWTLPEYANGPKH